MFQLALPPQSKSISRLYNQFNEIFEKDIKFDHGFPYIILHDLNIKTLFVRTLLAISIGNPRKSILMQINDVISIQLKKA